ncbi:MAG: hypothetical protein EBQ92_09745 [Proteobacteria bacterium]|nr:hypothetical protein [Pseudomonadota bacterium]
MELSPQKKILFLYPYGYWRANPICVSLIERCQSDNLSFDLFCPTASHCLGEGKEIAEWVWFVRRIIPSAIKQSFRRPWKSKTIWESVVQFFRLKGLIHQNYYSLIVTCDATGLSLLSQMKLPQKIPVVYLSFHILFRSELRTANERALARNENALLSSISLAMSQDETRMRLLSKELDLSQELFDCIAVAPEERFPFPPKISTNTPRKMVLYCGNLEKWNVEEILEKVARNIPPEFYLRVHTHFKPPNQLLNKIRYLEKRNQLHFTFDFHDERGLVDLIDESYIGLAPYFPQPSSWMVNQTLFHIGKASTKIAYYCSRKKPVITTPLPSLQEALSKYPFGVALTDWADIGSAIAQIDSSYSLFSENAYRYYQGELNPTLGLNQFWEKTKALIPKTSA